jgi:hypothetical protein
MGILMNFYAGRAAAIVSAIEAEGDPREVASAAADFSLHIGYDELDEMLAAACERQKRERITWDVAAQHDEPLSDDAVSRHVDGSVNQLGR